MYLWCLVQISNLVPNNQYILLYNYNTLLPCNYGDIYERLFSYLPVVRVSFDKAGEDDKQEYKHIYWSEDFVDPGWLFHTKWQKSWASTKTTELSTKM